VILRIQDADPSVSPWLMARPAIDRVKRAVLFSPVLYVE